MSIIEKQWKLIAGFFALLIGVGLVATLATTQTTKKEQTAQESYFLAEKKFLEIKNKKTADAETTDSKKSSKDVKKTETQPTAADYSESKKDFEKIIANFPGSKAAQMASVYLSDILIGEKNMSGALSVLQKNEGKDFGLINTLIQQQIGQLLADQEKCSEAIQVWQKIIDHKEATFLHNEVKIQQALCYKKMNDMKKAEELLTNLANQKSESNGLETSATSKEAEKYLRLIQFKKATGT